MTILKREATEIIITEAMTVVMMLNGKVISASEQKADPSDLDKLRNGLLDAGFTETIA